MAYHKSLLLSVMQWKKLTDELCVAFAVHIDLLPNVLQRVLEAASDGQRAGFQQAQKQQPPPKVSTPKAPKEVAKAPKKSTNKNYRDALVTKAVKHPKDRPTPQETVVKVMKPNEILSMAEIIERIITNGWQPNSSNYKGYVQHLISREVTNKGGRGRIKRVGMNQYRLHAWYVASLKPAKLVIRQPAKVVGRQPVEAEKTPAAMSNGAGSHS